MQGPVPSAKPERLLYSQVIHLPQTVTAKRSRQREILQFLPIYTLKLDKLGVSSASSENPYVCALYYQI